MSGPIPGWPTSRILSVTRTKVGDHPGCDEAEVTFAFDQPVTEWVVRVNSTSHLDGAFVARGTSMRRGFGRQFFGRSPFGRPEVLAGVLEPTVRVSREDLQHGPNKVTVYARATADGPWR